MDVIMSLNCGTSSAKYALYEMKSGTPLCRGVVERVTTGGSFIRHEVPENGEFKKEHECADHTEAIRLIFDTISGKLSADSCAICELKRIKAVGHRVVHGGHRFVKSALVTDDVYDAIVEMIDFGPLHNPANLAGIDACRKLLPSVPQVAVFDTAFFQTLPPKAYLYGCAKEWYDKYGVRKYGFHGSSHLYLSRRASAMLSKHPGRTNLVTLHIGNGISLTAVKNGRAVDHSMGLSPLEGVMMGTRSGDVDPAIIPFICRKERLNAGEVVNTWLNRKSGVFGFTGITDIRDLCARVDQGDESSMTAYELYCYKIKKYLGAYLCVLDYGVDAIVFAGGVGENGWSVRRDILQGFENVGIVLDSKKNRSACGTKAECDISSDDSRIRILVIPTNEEQVLLEDVVAILEDRYDDHTRFSYSFESSSWGTHAQSY
ncbi:MAG: acetate kinase [Spirochaetes bacterium]|nr:acetate kinase [Spirochaetota bacterium]